MDNGQLHVKIAVEWTHTPPLAHGSGIHWICKEKQYNNDDTNNATTTNNNTNNNNKK